MEIYHGLQVIFLGLALVGVTIHLFGWLGLLLFYFRKAPKLNDSGAFPGVTVIKPCYSNEDLEEINFDHFFNQNYPGPIQLLFVVSQETDPIVPVIRKLLNRYPKKDAQLIISKTRNAYWRKIDALFDAHQAVKSESEIVIWSDSDTIVRPEYIREMVASLQEPGVSMVTTPQYDVGADNFATAVKTLGNNSDVSTYVTLFDLFVRDKKAGFGHSIGFWLKDFKEFESKAWDVLNNSFADDLIMPTLFTEHGKQVVYRNIYCPVQYSGKTFRQMLAQQEKFSLCQKAFIGRVNTFFRPVVCPQIWSTALVLIAPQSSTSWVAFFVTFGIRVLTSLFFESLILKSTQMTLRYFWALPIWDLMNLYFVTYALTHHRFSCHGVTYEFENGLRLRKVDLPGEEAIENQSQMSQQNGWAQPDSNSASVRLPS